MNIKKNGRPLIVFLLIMSVIFSNILFKTTKSFASNDPDKSTEFVTDKTTTPNIEKATQWNTKSTTQSTTESTTQPSTKNELIAESTIPPTIQSEPSTEIITITGDINNSLDNTIYPPIQNDTYDLIDLLGISIPENNNETFKIIASGKISSITYGIIQEPVRLYIDIENSISKLNENIPTTGSSIVKSIRTAQQADKKNVTRIVFDLSNEPSYDIYLSEDRQILNIKFKPVVVEKIVFQNIDGEDNINIYSNSKIITNIMELSNPDRIVIDIPNTISNIGNKEMEINGEFISSIRTSQFDASTVRVVLDTTRLVDYKIIDNNSYITIRLVTPTYKNIYYENSDNSPKLMLKKDFNQNIDINLVKHEDKYLDGYYKIILPGDYSNIYGYGNYRINDGYLKSINIENNNGNTEFIFNEKKIYTCVVTEDEENIYLNIYNPKSVYKKVVVIDPGHGGSAVGAVQNGVTEKHINLDVANRLYLLLEKDPDIKVYATRTTDVNPSFDYRTSMANHSADMFVSIHCNSIASASISGVQVFYPNPADNRGAISKKLGDFLMTGVTSNIGFVNRPANQAMGYDFKVLRETIVPACLVELGFLTNKSDALKLASPDGRQQAAKGIYEGIKKGFEVLIPSR